MQREPMTDREMLEWAAKAAGPSRRLRIAFACNDGRNGLFAGKAVGAVLSGRGWELELEPDAWLEGYAFTVDSAGLRLRIHRQWFPFTREKEWYGNWCWNLYELKRPAALRLLTAMRDSGRWHSTAGPSLLCTWWSRAAAELGRMKGDER